MGGCSSADHESQTPVVIYLVVGYALELVACGNLRRSTSLHLTRAFVARRAEFSDINHPRLAIILHVY